MRCQFLALFLLLFFISGPLYSVALLPSRSLPVLRILRHTPNLNKLSLTEISNQKTSPRIVKCYGVSSVATDVPLKPLPAFALWFALFALSASLHSAEAAITKISPWHAEQVAESEGPRSAFAMITKDLRRLLITILLTTTACSIYSTALFVSAMQSAFPSITLPTITAFLTFITLLVGEILPKAIAVGNSDWVARLMVPWINYLSMILRPATSLLSSFSDLILRIIGLKASEDSLVSEDMLRRVVVEASKSGAKGIAPSERRMITAVLDMQDKEISRVMTPRVDIVAVDAGAEWKEVLQVAQASKYSRLPVYRGDVDHIVGVIASRSLLPRVGLAAQNVTAADLMTPVVFVPESMTCWNALQEMRRRSMHMLVVVDEYGGTSGIITLEDVLEEVVGEIYDEEDMRREKSHFEEHAWTIARTDGRSFIVKAWAELDDVCEALDISLPPEDRAHSTIGGLLCAIAGRIPDPGAVLSLGGHDFEIRGVEDGRRLVDIYVTRHDSSTAKLEPIGETHAVQIGREVFEDGRWKCE